MISKVLCYVEGAFLSSEAILSYQYVTMCVVKDFFYWSSLTILICQYPPLTSIVLNTMESQNLLSQ